MGFKTMNRFPGEDLSDDVLPPTYFMGESNWMLLERRDFLAEFAASRASRLLPCTELQLFRSGHQCSFILFHNGSYYLYHLEYVFEFLSSRNNGQGEKGHGFLTKTRESLENGSENGLSD